MSQIELTFEEQIAALLASATPDQLAKFSGSVLPKKTAAATQPSKPRKPRTSHEIRTKNWTPAKGDPELNRVRQFARMMGHTVFAVTAGAAILELEEKLTTERDRFHLHGWGTTELNRALRTLAKIEREIGGGCAKVPLIKETTAKAPLASEITDVDLTDTSAADAVIEAAFQKSRDFLATLPTLPKQFE